MKDLWKQEDAKNEARFEAFFTDLRKFVEKWDVEIIRYKRDFDDTVLVDFDLRPHTKHWEYLKGKTVTEVDCVASCANSDRQAVTQS